MQVGLKPAYDCVRAFSETDFTEDLRRTDVPALVVHGDDDQIVPFPISGKRSAELLPQATLTVYEGAPHGITGVPRYAERFHRDLLDFLRG